LKVLGRDWFVMNPFTEIPRGFAAYWQGWSWLLRHPVWILALLLPAAIAMVCFFYLSFYLFSRTDDFLVWLKPMESSQWWLAWIYYVSKMLLSLTLVVVSGLVALLLSNILSVPIYEFVSVAVERQLTGRVVEVSLLEALKLIPEEIKKVLFILSVTLVVLFIPFLNIFSTFIAAFLVAWDFFDYPMARRGYSFRRRLYIASKNVFLLTAFGLWLVIPIVNVFLFPFAIAGGTILNLQSLQNEGGSQHARNGT
jgi:CysZ protein